MKSQHVQQELVAYHFGVVEEPLRLRVETHLLVCQSCLADFVALKREIEVAEHDERPSLQARANLREAVAAQIGASGLPQPWAWWERPLAFGLAAAVLVMAVFVHRTIATTPGTAPLAVTNPVP